MVTLMTPPEHPGTGPFLALIGAGLVILGGTVVTLRKRLGRLYDYVDMPDEDRARFKTFVLPLLGWVLVGLGFLLLGSEAVRWGGVNLATLGGGYATLERALGLLLVLLGVGNIVSHATGWPRPNKLAAMKGRYGIVLGRIVHLTAYSAVPIATGLWLALR